MSDRMQAGAALEQLREVASILRELSNAGPRDNSFKQWRQVTLTLLQRIWPDDQGRAARFRRIPFSPPSSRADSKTIRECFERGCCEAIAYLDNLVGELEKGSRQGRPLTRPAEAPIRDVPEREQSPAAPVRAQEPPPPAPVAAHLSNDPEFEGPRAQAPLVPAEAPPPPPPAAREPAAPPAPPPSRPASAPGQPAPGRAGNGRIERRSKPRLKDMLGFSDEDASAPAQRASSTPAAPVARPAPPAPPAPVAPPPPPAPVVASPPPPEPRRTFLPRPPADAPLVVEPIGEEPIVDEPFEEEPFIEEPVAEEPVAPEPEWLAPVVQFPTHRAEQGRVTTYSPAPVTGEPSPYDEPTEEFDLGFDLGPGMEAASEPAAAAPQAPPTTLREMLDRAAAPSVPAPSRSAREVLAMASAVDSLGVPPQRRAIVCAALIDLGHQMETPPVQWAAIRQALAFMMDYPQIARRVLPMLMPYLDEAA